MRALPFGKKRKGGGHRFFLFILFKLAALALVYHILSTDESASIINDYTQIVFSALMGLIAFGEIPDCWSLIGVACIFAVALFMFLRKES